MKAGPLQQQHLKTTRRVLRHMLFWMAFYLLQFYYGLVSVPGLKIAPAMFLNPLRLIAGAALVFYPLMYWIIPRFFARKKYRQGIFWSLLLFGVFVFMDAYWEIRILNVCSACWEQLRIKQPDYYNYLHRGLLGIALTRLISLGFLYQLMVQLAIPIGIKIAMAYFQQRLTTVKLEKENKELELHFLRSQIAPHFLFNTLNNIYGLILHDDRKRSAATVAQLASFLRYSLYPDTDDHTLGREIRMLQDYMELEKIRLNHALVNFTFEADDPSLFFPPLLLMPVLENAFKFCPDSPEADSWIWMQLVLRKGYLYISVANTVGSKPHPESGGIGHDNIRRRLQYYYGGNHTFVIHNEKNIYTVVIEIQNAYDSLYRSR
ncbi:sensor histidine kinase [Niabella sp. CC-SYL272]|uniref:sensor histidine kinase n=1 Tax=Niabella agricola TaxID=2891571 RepID=UPI001F290875|nr:sensor histidine kinase [Niabella agricola]MCF3108259.1 sensor histidine kinase [Niabella agricola]